MESANRSNTQVERFYKQDKRESERAASKDACWKRLRDVRSVSPKG